MSMGMIYQQVKILQKYFPERLGKAYLVNTPWIFNATWVLIKSWLDPRTASKVYFLEEKDMKEVLISEIDEDVLEVKYGGNHSRYESLGEQIDWEAEAEKKKKAEKEKVQAGAEKKNGR